MSKEFEEWKQKVGVESNKFTMRNCFAAGRALGRREVKGKAKQIAKDHDFPEHVDCDGCRTARMIVSAIEAIPEEV